MTSPRESRMALFTVDREDQGTDTARGLCLDKVGYWGKDSTFLRFMQELEPLYRCRGALPQERSAVCPWAKV